jgi:hypothetical protein
MEHTEHGHEVSEGSGTEKMASVVEAMQYRLRAQAAEKELAELKEQYEKQGKELAEVREKAEGGEKDTPSPLCGTPPSQGESFLRTQGARKLRGGSLRGLMERAAVRAAQSGRRADLQEYLRVRRAYV